MREAAANAKPDHKLSEIKFLPVIPNPDKILCIGLNYETHRKETGRSEVEIVQEIMGSYLRGVEEVREMLDRRLDDLERGRVKPHTPNQLWENLERRKTAYLQQRS